MDILQNLVGLLGQGASQKSGAASGGGLGGMLDPNMLSGLVGSLMGGKGGARSGATAPGGLDIGGLIGSLMGAGGGGGSGAGGLGGLLGSLMGGGDEPPPPAPQAQSASPEKLRQANLLRALIYAARADGHIDQQEEASINEQVRKLGFGAEAQAMVNQFMSEPLQPAKIAANITDPSEALNIFALSCALTQMDQPAERQYLDSLGDAMRVPKSARAEIIKRLIS